jgi:cellulose biosynthesis protein BcsQ
MDLLNTFDASKKFKDITKPEVLTVSTIIEYQPSKDEKAIEIMANVANKINTIQKNDKTMAQKIKEEIEKRINPNKVEKDIIPQEVKDAILNDVDIEMGQEQIQEQMDELANRVITKRAEELKNIGNGGVVSKMLSNNPNKPGINLKKLSETIVKK